MSKEGWPVEQRLTLATTPCSVLFHFRRNDEEVRYFPTIKYEGNRIEFMFKDAQVIINQPAVLLLENTLHFFDQDVDGKKLSPFLNKRFISIPRSAEKNYFKLFVGPLIEKHNVYAQGFEIKTQQFEATPIIELSVNAENDCELFLHFRYGPYVFKKLSDNSVTVKMEYDAKADNYIFYRIKRSLLWEENRIRELKELGLEKVKGKASQFEVSQSQDLEKSTILEHSLVDWLNEFESTLKEKGFEVSQKEGEKQFVFGQMALDLEVREENDWFDVQALVHF